MVCLLNYKCANLSSTLTRCGHSANFRETRAIAKSIRWAGCLEHKSLNLEQYLLCDVHHFEMRAKQRDDEAVTRVINTLLPNGQASN